MRERKKSRLERSAVRTHLSNSTPETIRSTSASHNSGAEPTQIGRTQLSPEERLRRRQSNQCFYCGSTDHFLANCPICPKRPGPSVSEGILTGRPLAPRLSLPAT
ncbi:hypothetical protein CHARACLAT_031894 [Characodon lateralis]|uniref:CCHC-type domain-containing protein n=1 Tax=Characodon lateralis TaxID=208331 RepID=A0ABU7DVY6_9TELE|nr:hypothetical protein [Characodon lateralis]